MNCFLKKKRKKETKRKKERETFFNRIIDKCENPCSQKLNTLHKYS